MGILRIFTNDDTTLEPLSRLDLFLLGIDKDTRKKLACAEKENDIERYKDILFLGIYDNNRNAWWHT